MVLRASSKSASKGSARVGRTGPGHSRPAPPLTAAMACDTAFRVVARHYLNDLTAHHDATCEADARALHEMRIALTRLRTAIAFFSPMVADPQQALLRDELKWLNSQLGAVRDFDVAIERLEEINQQRSRTARRSWSRKRDESQRHLTRALRSARYRRLIKGISLWIKSGTWSTKPGTQATGQRACPVTKYSARKLTQWREKLIRKSRKLEQIGTERRHRLRLLNKRLSYAIESVAGLISDKETMKLQATLKVLRKAQRSLGQLNDDARYRSLATALGQETSGMLPGPKHEKRRIRTAAKAYENLSALKPFRI